MKTFIERYANNITVWVNWNDHPTLNCRYCSKSITILFLRWLYARDTCEHLCTHRQRRYKILILFSEVITSTLWSSLWQQQSLQYSFHDNDTCISNESNLSMMHVWDENYDSRFEVSTGENQETNYHGTKLEVPRVTRGWENADVNGCRFVVVVFLYLFCRQMNGWSNNTFLSFFIRLKQ